MEMQRPALIFEHSPLFIIVCILAGLAYAYVQYQKSGPWGQSLNRILFVARALLVSVIAMLLVSPILKQVKNVIEEPTYVIAVDNSSSIARSTDSTRLRTLYSSINDLVELKKEEGYAIDIRTIDGESHEKIPSDVKLDYSQSDLAGFLDQISADYEGRNLSGALLVSDGIFNEGISPTFTDYNYNIDVLGVGDTIPKADVSIRSVVYNKISYQGNQFPVVVQFTQKGFEGRNVNVAISQGSKVIESKTVGLKSDHQLNEIRFLVEASEKGFQRYTVRITPLANEFTTINNTKQVYVEVIEGTENIAVVAAAPHPDIKALRFAIESNSNYTFDQFIYSLPADRARLANTTKQYDLIIFHQLPDRRGVGAINPKMLEGVAQLFIYGESTDIRFFNEINEVLTLDAVPGEYDKVTASFNQEFMNFKLSEGLQQTFTELPPINVPFGKIDLSKGTKVMLYQQVGSIVTTKPLIALNEEITPKKAVVLGDGLWKWRLTSFVNNESHEQFNELITKPVQFLSSKDDRRKFKAYPIKNESTTNEAVVFDSEVYNDLYERVYGNRINLTVTDSEGKARNFTFITNENNTRYTISGLPEGIYNYSASTNLNGSLESVSGEFLVKDLQVEDINLTADFDLLRELSAKNGGQFYLDDELEDLKNNNLPAQGIIHSSEQYLPFINIKWLFF
ncbi:VWA domain-containing protein, partial [Fulvivirga aurantia]|uniref:VWA domain-containing protein n=1 Tax=Fulvivirga aurantia TaxID=2529383 RepID=UPI0016248FB7